MKITFLATHMKVNGGNRVILGYADVLSRMGHNVTVVIQNTSTIRRWIANTIGKKPSWFKNFSGNILRIDHFDEVYFPKADITVSFSSPTAPALNSSSEKKVGKKFYYILHDERLYHGNPEEVAKTYTFPLTRIVLSSWVQENLRRDFQADSTLLIPPLYDEFLTREYSHNTSEKIRILLVCHDYTWKGTREGVDIVQKLKKKYSQIELVLFGSRKKNIEYAHDEYHFNPSRFELPPLYASCDIYLCTSWDEGLGLPSMETMAQRCALATFDTGGSRDFAFDGKTALVAPRRDTAALAQKLEILVADKAIRKKIADGGYTFIRTLPKYAEQTKKLERLFINA